MKDGKISKDNTVFVLICRELLALYYWYVIYSQNTQTYNMHTHIPRERERERQRVGEPSIFILLSIYLFIESKVNLQSATQWFKWDSCNKFLSLCVLGLFKEVCFVTNFVTLALLGFHACSK